LNRIALAEIFAKTAHRAVGQKRKYTGECYTVHTSHVAELVESFGGSEEMICAAHLHDVVEDTDIVIGDVEEVFGSDVASLVDWLTDVSKPEDGNRAVRKEKDRQHSAEAPAEAQTIKCCDLISNAASILPHDPSFATVYLKEMGLLLDAMTKAHPPARDAAHKVLEEGRK